MIEKELFHSGFLPPVWAYGLGLALTGALLVLLWQELRRNRHALRFLLFITRAGMGAILTLLLAQPNLLITTRQQHEGRTLSIVDDSASMFTVDTWSDTRVQVELARLMALPEMAGRPTEFQEMADSVRRKGGVLGALGGAVHDAMTSIRTGLPWSDQAQRIVTASQPALIALRGSLDALLVQNRMDTGARQLAEALVALLKADSARGRLLFDGARPLQQADWEGLERTLKDATDKRDQLVQRLLAQQAEADREFLTGANRQAALTGQFRDLTRYALSRRIMSGAAPLAAAETLNLHQGKGGLVDASSAAPRTDLVQNLASALYSRPLDLINAVCLFSDGGQNCNYDLDALDIYRKRGVPLVVVGTGTERASEALTLADLDYPLLVTTRTPMVLTLEWRANLPEGTRIDLNYDLEGDAGPEAPKGDDAPSTRRSGASTPTGHELPYHESVVAAGKGWLHHRTALHVARPGFQRLRVQASVADPAVKISRTLPVYVSAERPAVLVVAERPDPLTESLLAQKRFGVSVFPVFTYQKEANVKRGDSKSMIPRAAKDWSRYELVVLSGRPFPGFGKDDAMGLAEAVRAQGLSVVVLEGGDGGYVAALESALGMGAPAAKPSKLAVSAGIMPRDEVLHVPMLRLSSDLIRNQNIWMQFQSPGSWWSVPEQGLSLIRQVPSQTSVMTLGFHGAGRVMYCGLGEWSRMGEWQSASFERLVTRLAMDLLVPDGRWETGKAWLGLYPAGVPGKPSMILAKTAQPSDSALELVGIEGPDGKSAVVPLKGKEGWFQLSYVFSQEGAHKLTAGGASYSVDVRRLESSEARDLSLRDDFLRQLASAAGGTYVSLQDLPETLSGLDVKTRDSIQTRTVRTLDFTVALLVLFVVLASADFALRKQIGMVL